jgi:hypothetical protein
LESKVLRYIQEDTMPDTPNKRTPANKKRATSKEREKASKKGKVDSSSQTHGTGSHSGVGETHSPEPSTLGGDVFKAARAGHRRGTGEESAGQSGDVQGLSRAEEAESESVEGLVEEGQFHEADVVSGVENALDPDQGEVRTRRTR